MLNRQHEETGMFSWLAGAGVGSIVFSPLAQGLLTDKYLHGIPAGSRATRNHFLKESSITPELVAKIASLNEIAKERGQSLAQMALAWILRLNGVTSVLIGASRPEQIAELVKTGENLSFSTEELCRIDSVLNP